MPLFNTVLIALMDQNLAEEFFGSVWILDFRRMLLEYLVICVSQPIG